MDRMRGFGLCVALAACELLSTTSAQSTATTSTSQFGHESAKLPPTPVSLGSSPTISDGPLATWSTSSEPRVHTIKAGSGGFKFTPQELSNVSVGDTVTFYFYPLDHSVIQADFGSACVPYSYVDKEHAGKGFWTETQWVNTTADVSRHVT